MNGYHFFPFPPLAFSKNQQKNHKTTRQITSPKKELCIYVRRHKRQEIKTKKWLNKYLYFFFHCCRRFFFSSSPPLTEMLHCIQINPQQQKRKKYYFRHYVRCFEALLRISFQALHWCCAGAT